MLRNKNLFRIILLVVLCALSFVKNSAAQGFSYVYIQGDKKTPIYVKVEDVMLPRYGKNYALISRLAPGPLNLEILFQQNEYPAIQFAILVPENGKRAFVLSKQSDGFALFDVEQNFYLKANNDISEDHLPKIIANTGIANNTIEETVANADTKETIAGEQAIIGDTIPKTENTVVGNKEPQFMDNITFNNDNETTSAKENSSSVNRISEERIEKKTEISNSDCQSTIGFIDFNRLKNRINSRNTEDEKLGFVLSSVKDNCFSTAQAKELVELLETDIARYSALKSLYPKISDQSEFPSLASTLKEEDWKEYFLDLIGH